MNYTRDKQLLEEGCGLLKKSIEFSNLADEYLSNITKNDTDLQSKTSRTLGCFFLATSIETSLKGLLTIIGIIPENKHYIKNNAILFRSPEVLKKAKEFRQLDSVLDICSQREFSTMIHFWIYNGRFKFFDETQDNINKAIKCKNRLQLFIRNFKLDTIIETSIYFKRDDDNEDKNED